MNLGQLEAATRFRLQDEVHPYLVSSAQIHDWANEAVTEAAIRARLLKHDDLTDPDLCIIGFDAGQAVVEFSPLIFVVMKAWIAGERYPLVRRTARGMDRECPGWDQDSDRRGIPEYAVVDIQQKTIRLFPVPEEAGELRLRIWRAPKDTEAMSQSTDEPVIRLTQPEALVHWILYKARLVPDSELANEEEAAKELALFEAAFGRRPSEGELNRWHDSPMPGRRGHYF